MKNSTSQKMSDFDRLVGLVVHDLKAPLRNISQLTTMAEADLDAGELLQVKTQLNTIKKRIVRLNYLLEGLFEYSNIGGYRQDSILIDANELVIKIFNQLNESPLNFRLSIESELPRFVTFDHLLEKVFFHLIENSLKHDDKNSGTLRVGHKDAGEFYEFFVADEGPGIENELADKVFEVFITLKARDKFESCGIGLAVSKRIVEELGGKIWLKRVQVGTTICFQWPKSVNI